MRALYVDGKHDYTGISRRFPWAAAIVRWGAGWLVFEYTRDYMDWLTSTNTRSIVLHTDK